MDELRVLVVANDPLARAGLVALLAQTDCEVVGQVAADPTLSAEFNHYQPDVALWDLGWDPAAHLDVTTDLVADLTEAGLPLVALLPDAAHAADLWMAGASGLLGRDTDAESLVAAMQAAVAGLRVVDHFVATTLMPNRELAHDPLAEELTPRETEVLQLLADGLTNKAIAQKLGISEHTVKFHVNAILGKLQAQSRTEAVVRATRLGLLLL
jgi:two-component system nitrate/nitrite response regulator NarL